MLTTRSPVRTARRALLTLTGAAALAVGCGRTTGADVGAIRYRPLAGQPTPTERALERGHLAPSSAHGVDGRYRSLRQGDEAAHHTSVAT